MDLRPHQKRAVERLSNGKVLYGGVGSGKSLTAMVYWKAKESGRRVYVVTTARKRDSLDWVAEGAKVGLTNVGDDPQLVIDSWNKIKEYTDVRDAFFIFDEQRLVGRGVWVKAFLKIAKQNHWIVLSATPGDTWMDYSAIFIANGHYRNITEFREQHVVYETWSKYPKIKCYRNTRKLELLRNSVLVEMPYEPHTERVLNWVDCAHDEDLFRRVYGKRWNVYEDRPIRDVAEMFRVMRRVVNSDPSRLGMTRKLMRAHPKLIIFYNFNYELDILRQLSDEVEVAEWNGHRKNPVPKSTSWVYLVQYVAGAEAWNCVETDAMIMYSLTYSYRNFEQVQGRIDRLNSPYDLLYYYIYLSNSVVDRAIRKSLDKKESFNEQKFVKKPFDLDLGSDEMWGIFD